MLSILFISNLFLITFTHQYDDDDDDI